MKKLLVCTDFSKAGNNAAGYAALFAQQVKAELMVVNFWNRNQFGFSAFNDNHPSDFSQASINMSGLVVDLRKLTNNQVLINGSVHKSSFYNGLSATCKSYRPQLVLLGSQANNVHLGIFGSKSIYAGKNMKIPLVVVPVCYSYERIDRIGMASDLGKTITDAVGCLKTLARELNAVIHVLYAAPAGITDEKQFHEARQLVNLVGTENCYHSIASTNVDDDIMDYLAKQKVQLLAVIPRKHSFLTSLFYPSHTKHFIRYSTIPVLVLRSL